MVFKFLHFLYSRSFLKLHILVQLIEFLLNSLVLLFLYFRNIRKWNKSCLIHNIFTHIIFICLQLFFFLIIRALMNNIEKFFPILHTYSFFINLFFFIASWWQVIFLWLFRRYIKWMNRRIFILSIYLSKFLLIKS